MEMVERSEGDRERERENGTEWVRCRLVIYVDEGREKRWERSL